jgi:hypothetical protein
MDKLDGGGELRQGESLKSPNGRFELKMQQDGNVVLYDEAKPIWATNTQRDGAERLAMQDDGNFVVYADRKPVWSSKTPGNQGASLKLQDDGNLVVYPPSSTTKPLWASGTYRGTPAPATPMPATPMPATPMPATPMPATPMPATPMPATPMPAGPSASVKSMNATPTSMPGVKPSAAKSGNRRTYTVAKGDSLWRIAEKFYGSGSDFSRIAKANSISDPDHIRPGQQLVIPE